MVSDMLVHGVNFLLTFIARTSYAQGSELESQAGQILHNGNSSPLLQYLCK